MVALAVAAAACTPVASTPLPARFVAREARGFLSVTTGEVNFLRWSELSGRITGSVQSARVSTARLDALETLNRTVSGVRQGERILFDVGQPPGPPALWSGRLRGRTLSLFLPGIDGSTRLVVFTASMGADFSHAVADLRASLQLRARSTTLTSGPTTDGGTPGDAAFLAARRRAEAEAANRNLLGAVMTLADTMRTLATDTATDAALRGYESDWSTLQAHYQQAQQGFAKQPPDCTAVTADVAAIDTDLARIEADGGPLTQLAATIAADETQVLADLDVVRQRLADLQQALAAVTGPPPRTLTAAAVDLVAVGAQQQIAMSGAALDRARARTAEIEQSAAQLYQQAHAEFDGCGS